MTIPFSSSAEVGAAEPVSPQLLATRAAFDSVAADYDGPRGNNALIRDMRAEMWRWLDATFTDSCRLIDLGCGTGLDAVRMARSGHHVTAVDWSPGMIERTRARAAEEGVGPWVHPLNVGAHELDRLSGHALFGGAYSNLGALNCIADLEPVARELARLIRPGGALVFTVIGRVCPWEICHYARSNRWSRIAVRFARGLVPVGMNGHTVWARYYRPREFYRAFRPYFRLVHYRALALVAPPPYLTWVRERHPSTYSRLWSVERKLAGWSGLRNLGDHFLIILSRR